MEPALLSTAALDTYEHIWVLLLVDCACAPRWCMDMCVPASTCAVTTPKGLHQSQEEEAPNVVTPPLSHWTHREPQSLD